MWHFCGDEFIALCAALAGIRMGWTYMKGVWAKRHKAGHCVHREPCEKE